MLGVAPRYESTNMDGAEDFKLTVQGLGTPVPATLESDQAGSLSSISSYCNVVKVDDLAEATDNTTSALQTTPLKDPFERSGMINRSPIQKLKNWPLPMLRQNDRVRSESALNLTGTSSKETKVDPWIRLGTRIEELIAFSKTRANIQNAEVKKLILGISSDYEAVKRLRDLKENGLNKNLSKNNTTEAQTSPDIGSQPNIELTGKETERTTSETIQKLGTSSKRKFSSPINGESPKRKSRLGKLNSQNIATSTVKTQAKPYPRDQNKTLKLTNSNDYIPSQAPIENKSSVDGEWRMVERKPRKKRQKVQRPDAVLIKKTGETSYADMLKKIKSELKI